MKVLVLRVVVCYVISLELLAAGSHSNAITAHIPLDNRNTMEANRIMFFLLRGTYLAIKGILQ